MNLKRNRNNKLILSVLFLLLFSGCANKNNESSSSSNLSNEYSKELIPSSDTGLFIENVAAISSSTLYSHENVVNCSGMSGSQSYLHQHDFSNPRRDMFLTQKGQKENYLILELERITQIGKVYIWNYNNFAKIDCSVKEFEVYYSTSGENFTLLFDETFTLSQNQGRSFASSSKINGLDYLDLQGISAKYLKFNFISNYGGDNFGLSEIRLYQYKSEAKQNNEVSANTIKLSPYYNIESNNLSNGSGISKISSLEACSSNDPKYMFKSKIKEITFDLNGNYPLSKIGIWNYNDKDHLEYGVKELEISYSINGKDFTLIDKYSLNKANGSNEEKVSNIISLDNLSAQYIRFNYLSSYGGNEYGLSEVKFILGKGRVSEPDIKYTGLFSQYSSWSGADGIFGVRLNGDQSISSESDTFFNFSDTYVGKVNPVTKSRINNLFRNNSFGYFADGKMEFVVDNEMISPIKNLDRSSSDAFNWLGDSFVIGNKYYATSLYIAKEGPLGFSQKGEDLVRFDIVDGKIDFSSRKDILDENTNKLSYFSSDGSLSIIFGSAYFENTTTSKAINPDGYIYDYGYRDDKNAIYSRGLVLCRFKEEDVEDFSKYQYLSSEGWVNDITKTIPLCERVSCEMSVTQINNEESPFYGKYLLTYQKDTISNEICIAISSTLEGPFENSQTIYSTSEILKINGVSQYNAKLHPTLSSKDKYVISYNLNENGSNLNAINGDIYHPRFICLFEI